MRNEGRRLNKYVYHCKITSSTNKFTLLMTSIFVEASLLFYCLKCINWSLKMSLVCVCVYLRAGIMVCLTIDGSMTLENRRK